MESVILLNPILIVTSVLAGAGAVWVQRRARQQQATIEKKQRPAPVRSRRTEE